MSLHASQEKKLLQGQIIIGKVTGKGSLPDVEFSDENDDVESL